MDLMYFKYKKSLKSTIAKNNDNVAKTSSKILPFKNSIESSAKRTTNNSIEDKINDEITDFFFNAVHKNYLATRKNL